MNDWEIIRVGMIETLKQLLHKEIDNALRDRQACADPKRMETRTNAAGCFEDRRQLLDTRAGGNDQQTRKQGTKKVKAGKPKVHSKDGKSRLPGVES